MIIREKSEGYDGKFRLIMYEPDEQGRLSEQSRRSEMEEQIETYYEQRRLEMERLKAQVVNGEISPIALCMTYQQMTLPDLASRAKLSKRQVKRHLTPEGFREVTVELLQRYARIFDLAVADFFQFLLVKEGTEVSDEHRGERLIQLVETSLASSEEEEK